MHFLQLNDRGMKDMTISENIEILTHSFIQLCKKSIRDLKM